MARGALEPATGIEPASPPWEGGVLPLDDADRSPLMSLRRPGSAGVVLTPVALREGPGRGRNVAGGYGTDRPYVVGERRPAELSSRPGGRQTRSLSLAPNGGRCGNRTSRGACAGLRCVLPARLHQLRVCGEESPENRSPGRFLLFLRQTLRLEDLAVSGCHDHVFPLLSCWVRVKTLGTPLRTVRGIPSGLSRPVSQAVRARRPPAACRSC